YPLTELLFVVICANLCGAQSWRDFVTFGEEQLDYLRRFLPFENGIPSKNTYARVFSILNLDEFKKCFISWIQSFQQALGNLIAIDGKTLKKFKDMSIRRLQKKAGWGDSTLDMILMAAL
ncbi:Transposase IS4 family protein, partial [Legionella moravica]